MKTLVLCVLVVIVPLISNAQEKYSEEYGKVTQHEISMTEYAPDPEAEAVVIYEIGTNYFQGDDNRGFLLHKERRTKIKVLKAAGTEYAKIEIPFYTDSRNGESVIDIEATVYNLENGKPTKTNLDPKKIFEEKIDNDLSVKKIALPDVREGSVIEFKYHIITPFFFNMGTWAFQKKIPVIHSQLIYKAIPYYEYTYIMRGTKEFHEFDSVTKNHDIHFGSLLYQEKIYTFGMKDLPAFRDEEFISAEEDYMISINFQVSKIYFASGSSQNYISTWPALCDDFLKKDNFGKYIKNSEKEGKKLLPTLNLDSKSQLDQTIEITQYVKSMYKWNDVNNKFAEDKLSDFLKSKSGNSANINLYLIGLLKAANINVNPLVLSTRNHGGVSKSHPFQQFLNYVIAQVEIDGKTYFIDATEPLRYFDELPTRCTNVEALVVKPKNEEWVITTQKEVARTSKAFKVKINPDQQTLDINIKYTLSGQDAYQFRNIYEGKDDNLVNYFKKNNNVNIEDSLITNDYKELNKPFSFSFQSSTGFEKASDKLFISPFCNLSVSENIFKQETRTLPIDLIYLRNADYTSEVEIPKGYKVEYLPKELKHDSRLMSIKYSTKVTDNKIEVTAGYFFNTNLYDAKDYVRLKYSYAEIIKQFSDMIVFVKE
ncbi:DUF3857 domain-containing protein [Dysgonomonas sp. GY617]|uniref:DUF3857 domain-containing protein n=1 Tax=Dysgonomonas sp. GY617 TaxID=2780420 RepID=UPI001883661B|nr:DUF3857 domain-containing protein [Dysgonomonas sp. GY617]MBF0574963.1 DUF3857 domain-containing protein [Dysgonomonas sp. GY617]